MFVSFLIFVFFFKQKTAYEMRISDWSSDVCSSDLPDCIVVCLPDEAADMRISNPRLSAREREALERLQREEEQEQLSLFQPTPEELKAAEDLRTQAEEIGRAHV